jgi:hypothetical protein
MFLLFVIFIMCCLLLFLCVAPTPLIGSLVAPSHDALLHVLPSSPVTLSCDALLAFAFM